MTQIEANAVGYVPDFLFIGYIVDWGLKGYVPEILVVGFV